MQTFTTWTGDKESNVAVLPPENSPEFELSTVAGWLGQSEPPTEWIHEDAITCATDPFEDFDDDDFDDEFDDDFEEEWDEELPGDADQFEPDEVEVEEDEDVPVEPEFDEEE